MEHDDIPRKLLQDYGSLYEQDQHKDVDITVGERRFRAHKAVLAVRSAVFAAMFEHEQMEEAKENRVTITDVDADVFEEMLRFVYRGEWTGKTVQMASDLFVAADKYGVEDLKSECEIWLIDKLQKVVTSADAMVPSAVDLLVMADMHSASRLKIECIKYIAR